MTDEQLDEWVEQQIAGLPPDTRHHAVEAIRAHNRTQPHPSAQ